MDAALRVLEARGPELLMDAVAAEAGVTKPVLYRYFHDKAALVDALAERGSEILLERLLPAIRAGVPALSRVRDAVGAYFAVLDEHPNLYWLLARQSKADAGGEQDSMARNREFIATTLTAVIGDYLRVVVAAAAFDEPRARGRIRHPDDLGRDLGDVARCGYRGGPGQAVPGGPAGVARGDGPGRAGPGVIRTHR